MKHLISLLAFFFLIGCDGEKSNKSPFEGLLGKADSETKPTEAVSAENPNLKYVIEGDAVTITDCAKDASGELVIPTKIEGKSVTNIGNEAFGGCTSLKSITIPDSVTSIGDRAFAFCTRLTRITIGDGVNSVGDEAFAFSESLTSIKIPSSVTSIGNETDLTSKNWTI